MEEQLEYIRNLSSEEKSLLQLYTTPFYRDFNQRLRHGWKLNKFPIVVYRGVRDEDENFVTYFGFHVIG